MQVAPLTKLTTIGIVSDFQCVANLVIPSLFGRLSKSHLSNSWRTVLSFATCAALSYDRHAFEEMRDLVRGNPF